MSIDRVATLLLQMTEDERYSVHQKLLRKGIDLRVELHRFTPHEALHYAAKNGGTDSLREIACKDSTTAYKYARVVDHGPHDITREAACKSSKEALLYALYVDRGPRDDTRESAHQDPYCAREYAQDVDKSAPPLGLEVS